MLNITKIVKADGTVVFVSSHSASAFLLKNEGSMLASDKPAEKPAPEPTPQAKVINSRAPGKKLKARVVKERSPSVEDGGSESED
jgi:hypothetical protein